MWKLFWKWVAKPDLLETNLHFPANAWVEEDFMKIFLPEKQILLAHMLAIIPDVSPDNISDCYYWLFKFDYLDTCHA